MFKIIKGDYNSTYDGLRIMSNPDLHEEAIKTIKNLNLDSNVEILILGSGSGAFDKRLVDAGFQNIVSVDIDKSNYKYANQRINFLQLDLNEDFYKHIGKTFDLIICLEIIEHVNSTNNFLHNCKKLMKKDSFLLISTPNVHDYFSRIQFLLFGYPTLFISRPVKNGHINPIFKNIFEYYLLSNGLEINGIIPISNFFQYLLIRGHKTFAYYFVVFLLSLILFPIYVLSLNKLNGFLSIYVIKKK